MSSEKHNWKYSFEKDLCKKENKINMLPWDVTLTVFMFHSVTTNLYVVYPSVYCLAGGARWLSGRVSDSGARGPGFETYLRRVVSLSKTLYSPKVLVNYPGSDGSVPT